MIRAAKQLAATIVLLILPSGSAWAGPTTVTFEDLTEMVTAMVGGTPPYNPMITQVSDEEVSVVLPNALINALPPGPVGAFTLTEPPIEDPKQGVSDVIFFDVIGANNTDLKIDFLSDSETGPTPTRGYNVYGSMPENGALQSIPLPPGIGSNLYPGYDGISVFAASDVVPEPNSLVLIGMGALGLGRCALRRRRRNVA